MPARAGDSFYRDRLRRLRPTLAAFTVGFVICGVCTLLALGLCAPLLFRRARAAVPESAGAGTA